MDIEDIDADEQVEVANEVIYIEEPQTEFKSSNERRMFTSEETIKLLDEYEKHVLKLRQGMLRRDQFWKNLAKELEKYKIFIPPQQAKSKFQTLKRSYTKAKNNNLQPNAKPLRFQYFHQFEQIFGLEEVINGDSEFDSFEWQEPWNDDTDNDDGDDNVGDTNTSKESSFNEHNYNEEKQSIKVWTPYETIRLIENYKRYQRRNKKLPSQLGMWDVIGTNMKSECIQVNKIFKIHFFY